MIRVLDEEGFPIVGKLLLNLRESKLQRDRDRFLTSLRRLGFILAHEATKNFPHVHQKVTTPLGTRSEPVLAARPVLATVLRAGLPLWQGAQEALPESDTLVLGAVREEGHGPDPDTGRIPINVSYARWTQLAGRPLIYCDPMLATGSTLIALHPRVVAAGGRPSTTTVIGVVAYRPTLSLLSCELGCDVVVASADDELDERGYIVPGLGDAGDLAFGQPNM
jgi:uracil phosphoribosyltransferase